MTNVQAVCRRVKSDIKLDLFLAEHLSHRIFIGNLLNKASLFQHVENVIVLTHIVRYKNFSSVLPLSLKISLCRIGNAAQPRKLLGSVQPIPGVAQSWHDIGVLVEALVLRRDIDIHIRMAFLQHVYSSGAAIRHINVIFLPPRSLMKSMAADVLPPVASMGSTTKICRFSISLGSLQ